MCPKTEERVDVQRCPYRSLVGSLMYAAVCTCPDISYAVVKLSQFLNEPGTEHWIAAKRIVKYLKGTVVYGPVYTVRATSMVGFADTDWGGDPDQWRSTNGFIFMMGGGPVS